MQCKKTFVIYADFKAILSPVSTVTQDPQISNTIKIAEYISCVIHILHRRPRWEILQAYTCLQRVEYSGPIP